MKTIRSSIVALAAAGLFLLPSVARAQSIPVNIKMTMLLQASISENGSVYTLKTGKVKVTTRDLLDLLAEAYGTTIPVGAQLMLVDFGYFQVQDVFGNILISNASDYLTYSDTYAGDDYLTQGRQDTFTGAQNSLYIYRSWITFDNFDATGNWFEFTGTMFDRYSLSTMDQLGGRKLKESIVLSGLGDGYGYYDYFILSGKITGKAKGYF